MGVGRIEKTYRRVGREGGKVQGNGLWGLQASINRVSTQYFQASGMQVSQCCWSS